MNESINERVAILDMKVSAAHNRVDKLELILRDDLKAIKEDVHKIRDWTNKAKGAIAVLLVLLSLVGGALIKVLIK